VISNNVNNRDSFKTKARIVIGKDVVSMNDDALTHTFNKWLIHNRSHYVVVQSEDEPLHDVCVLSASLVYTTHPKVCTTIVFDPVMLVDRLFNISFQDVNVIYLYDMHLLGVMPTSDVIRFFSYIKWALTQDVRCVIPIDCIYSREELGAFFSNKQVADIFMQAVADTRYCSRVEV